MPYSVFPHHKAEILIVVIHIPTQHIHGHDQEQPLHFRRYNTDTAGRIKQTFITGCHRVHCRQSLDVNFLVSLAVKPLGKEMRFLFPLDKHRRHHFHPCIPSHQIIAVFDTCGGQIKMFVKFDNHRGKTRCGGTYLSRITFIGFPIHVDDRFGSAATGRCSHLE